MDDVLRRLGAVEVTVLEIQKQVSGISTTLPTLSTKDDLHVVKDDVKDLRTEVGAIVAVIPHLATKADLAELSEKLIKWLIATGIATTGLIATAMKFVH